MATKKTLAELEIQHEKLRQEIKDVTAAKAAAKREEAKKLRSKRNHHLIVLAAQLESELKQTDWNWWEIDADGFKSFCQKYRSSLIDMCCVGRTMEEWEKIDKEARAKAKNKATAAKTEPKA